jgi:endonuclease-3 related protein
MGGLKDAGWVSTATLLTGAAFEDSMDRVMVAYHRLLDHYGRQHWWPAESTFEVMVGALLMQQTAWSNVEQAIANLKGAGLLEPHRLAAASVSTIRRHVRVSGLYRTKPARLKAFCRHLLERSDGDLTKYFDRPTEAVRLDLRSQAGVGPETADSILLYAGRHPVFVVDAYTVRIGRRLAFYRTDDYDAIQGFFERHLPEDASAYKEYHALLVHHAKTLCRPRPKCGPCPLKSMCAYARGQRS